MRPEPQSRTKVPVSSSTPARGALLQRKCACGGIPGADGECAECRKKRLQRKADNRSRIPDVPPIVHEVLRSPGQPLDGVTRALLEPRFGHDFARVRVHTDSRAVQSAKEVGALAYTVGSHVAFGEGRYEPGSTAGRRLLAHELAHVVQQGSSLAAPVGKGLTISPADHPLEARADAAAESAVQGGPSNPGQDGQPQLQRQIEGENRSGKPGIGNSTLPYREATELLKCIKIMGEDQAEYCRQEVLGEQPIRPTAGCGWFNANMSPDGGGLKGTLEFSPDPKSCPKCNLIRLVQTLRIFEEPGVDYVWPGKDKPKESMKSLEDKKKNIKPGFFVDHDPAHCSKGAGCSLYYRDHWSNSTHSKDGSNDGVTASSASLWDRPQGDANDIFEFETCARCDDTGEYLGCLDWGFTADKAGTVAVTPSFEHGAPSSTFLDSVARFDKYYANKK